jgi:hypothetical protein
MSWSDLMQSQVAARDAKTVVQVPQARPAKLPPLLPPLAATWSLEWRFGAAISLQCPAYVFYAGGHV